MFVETGLLDKPDYVSLSRSWFRYFLFDWGASNQHHNLISLEQLRTQISLYQEFFEHNSISTAFQRWNLETVRRFAVNGSTTSKCKVADF